MDQRRGTAVFFILLLAGMLAGAAFLPISKCPNCAGSGRAEFDVDQDWCGQTGEEPIVEAEPGWTTPVPEPGPADPAGGAEGRDAALLAFVDPPGRRPELVLGSGIGEGPRSIRTVDEWLEG